MATTTKKYQILQKLDENGNFVLLHPETTASQVIEETNKKFMTDAERSKLAGLSNYTHPTGFKDAPETALTGAKVISKIEVTNEGHVEGVTTRNLTPGNIGAEPAIASGSSGQYWDGTKTWKPLPTSLPADGGNADTVDGKHASDFILKTEKGAANGVATLDSTGKVPSSQLPSYVDDVEIIAGTVEYITLSTENPQAKFYSGLYTLQDLESQAWEGDKHSIYYSTTDKKLYRCTAAGYEQGDTSTWVQTTVTEIFGSVTYGKYFVVGDKTIRIIDGEPVSVSQFEKIIPGSTDRPLTDFEEDKVYLTFDNKTYRWNGYETMSHPVEKWGQLVVIGSDLALGETASTAYRGDRGKIAYDHSQSTGNPHGTTPAQIGAEPAFSKNTAFNKNFETNASNIEMNGTASAGSSTKVARADHVHPTDTSREPAIPAGNANQYWAGNKTWKNMPTSLPANGGNADTAGKLSSSRNFAITGDAVGTASSNLESGVSINVELKASGVVQGTYSAVSVNSKGIVTGGGYMVEIGTAGQTVPSDSLAVGGLFFKEV